MLKVDVRKPIASVILNRPDVHNAFNDELVKLVTDTFTELGARDDVRVIVFGGNGKSFCAGADLNWMKRMVQYSHDQNVEDARAVGRMYLTIAKCPKPVIARIHGAALGGGAGLVAACDIAVAVESVQFGFTEVKLGIIPAIIAPFVIARVGPGRARECQTWNSNVPACATQSSVARLLHIKYSCSSSLCSENKRTRSTNSGSAWSQCF